MSKDKPTELDYVRSICEIFGVKPELCTGFKIEPDARYGTIHVTFDCVPDANAIRQMIATPMPIEDSE
jgi:hypothetical protein